MLDLEIVILAAGRGTRMCSKRAKILHELAGQPLVRWVAKTAQALCPNLLLWFMAMAGMRFERC